MGFVPIYPRSPSDRRRRKNALTWGVGATILLCGFVPASAGTARIAMPDARQRVEDSGVRGRVLAATSPVVEVKVFAYQLAEESIRQVLTDGAGRFLFQSLPAGIYKIIAHKPGFEPTVLLLQRKTADEAQQVTLELERESSSAPSDYWSVRSEIPRDVLREIDSTRLARAVTDDPLTDLSGNDGPLRAEVSAMSGVEEIKPESDVRVSGGNVGVTGRLGGVKVLLEGDFQSFESASERHLGAIDVDGSTRSVSLSLQTPNQGVFDLASTNNRLVTSEDGLALPVEASQYRFGWNREVGEHGETSIQGFYLEESGLYNKGWIEPIDMPFASRTLLLEGNYKHKLEKGSLRAGMRYRERSGSYSSRYTGSSDDRYAVEFLDGFGGGDYQVNDTVLLEVGLFTTLRDGSVTLTPRGGIVLQLGENWQTSAAIARRIEVDTVPSFHDFLPVVVEDGLTCNQSELACYELSLQRGSGEGDHFAVGGSFRELDTTVRMFFSTNFFDHSEGLFLVPGDRIPEAHASFRKRLAPTVVTRFSTSVAEGGGGIYRAVNSGHFENEVSLVSTSLDTSFESTETGVFIAFHRLEQNLTPYNPIRRRAVSETASLERLELIVNQDLSTLLDLSTDWAIRIGMEFARGASFFHSDVDPEVLRRQVMTGVAVRF